MEMVADLADRVEALHYGQRIASGGPEEVLRHPEVVRVYIGAQRFGQTRPTSASR